MPGGGRSERSSIQRITVLSLLWVGIPFSVLFLLFKFYNSPDTIPQSREVSPDRRMRIDIVLEAYGTFGPVLYVARIGPNNDFLGWFFSEKLIELDGADTRTPVPTAMWVGANSVILQLPVKPDKLAATLKQGLYPKPAADRYGSVRILYRSR